MEIKSKYMIAMISAKRARQLFYLEQKENKINKEIEKNNLIESEEKNSYLTEKEKDMLKKHKHILVALKELNDNELEYYFEEK